MLISRSLLHSNLLHSPYFYAALPSLNVVIRSSSLPRLGASSRSRVVSPPSATCSNKFSTCNTRSAGSVAIMSTSAAIPQQDHRQDHSLHQNSEPPSDAFDSETPTSSRASSRSGRASRKSSSKSRKVTQPQPASEKRMSAFFPLGYKEAAYQWVQLILLQLHCTSVQKSPTTNMIHHSGPPSHPPPQSGTSLTSSPTSKKPSLAQPAFPRPMPLLPPSPTRSVTEYGAPPWSPCPARIVR